MDWSSWERKWEETLQGLAAATAAPRFREEEAWRRDSPMEEDVPPTYGSTQRTSSPRRRPSPHSQRQHQRAPSGAPRTDQQKETEQERQQPRQQQQQQRHANEQRHERQRQQKPRRPRPPSPPPPPRPPSAPSFAGKRYDTFAAFDEAFAAFERRLPSLTTVHLAEVPFPPRGDAAGVVAAGLPLRAGAERSDEERTRRKKLLHRGLLRWHPDKWAGVINKVEAAEHAALGECLRAITQEIVEMKGDLRWGGTALLTACIHCVVKYSYYLDDAYQTTE